MAGGAITYLYGLNRISQTDAETSGYFLGDALNSVRQVVDPEAEIKLVRSYSPYGETSVSLGDYETDYSYTGEMSDQSGLVNLRARYYDPSTGRFISKDSWAGDYQNPITLGKWLYAHANPILLTDPTGNDPWWCGNDSACYMEWILKYQLTDCIYENPPSFKPVIKYIKDNFGITLYNGNRKWDKANVLIIAQGLIKLNDILGGKLHGIIGKADFVLNNNDLYGKYYGETNEMVINFFITTYIPYHNLYHEFGHLLNNAEHQKFTTDLDKHAYKIGDIYLFGGGTYDKIDASLVLKSNTLYDPNLLSVDALQHNDGTTGEQWADIFANHVSNNINNNRGGKIMKQ